MENLDIQYLISIKSIFELNNDYSSLAFFLKKLSDRQIANKISNEIRVRNYGRVISEIDNYLYENNKKPALYETTDIKVFDFDYISKEKIEGIKKKIGVENIQLYATKDKEGNDTSLLRHWDNENRFAIIIDRNLSKEIKENPELELDVSKEIILANLGYYTKLTIEKYEEYQESYDYDYDYDDYYDNSNWLADAAGTDDPEVMNDVYWNLD